MDGRWLTALTPPPHVVMHGGAFQFERGALHAHGSCGIFLRMQSTSENKQLVRRYVEAFNRCDSEALRALFAPDAQIQGVLGWADIDRAVAVWKELHDAFAIELSVDEIAAEGDSVAARYTERGRFRGPFRGQPPTGKAYELLAMEWFIVRDGKIHRRWGARDSASQARQIGLPLGQG